MNASKSQNLRADARRSRARILDAALRVLNADPEASVEAIASAAGVTRQTVYAHFPTRRRLLSAVLDRVTEEAVAAMDAAALEAGSAADALLRLIDASARVNGRYPVLLQKVAALPPTPEAAEQRGAAVADRLKRVVERGQRTGEFDDRLSPDWLVAASIRLGQLACEETDAGRMVNEESLEALHTSLLRMLGVSRSPSRKS